MLSQQSLLSGLTGVHQLIHYSYQSLYQHRLLFHTTGGDFILLENFHVSDWGMHNMLTHLERTLNLRMQFEDSLFNEEGLDLKIW